MVRDATQSCISQVFARRASVTQGGKEGEVRQRYDGQGPQRAGYNTTRGICDCKDQGSYRGGGLRRVSPPLFVSTQAMRRS